MKKKFNPAQKRWGQRKWGHQTIEQKENAKIARYGINLQDKNRMLKEQDNSCGICGRELREAGPQGADHSQVDHCKYTGQVRQLLCFHCNVGLGHFQHDPELLQAAAEYLYMTGTKFMKKFSDEDVRNMHTDWRNGMSQTQICRKYGISRAYLSSMLGGVYRQKAAAEAKEIEEKLSPEAIKASLEKAKQIFEKPADDGKQFSGKVDVSKYGVKVPVRNEFAAGLTAGIIAKTTETETPEGSDLLDKLMEEANEKANPAGLNEFLTGSKKP